MHCKAAITIVMITLSAFVAASPVPVANPEALAAPEPFLGRPGTPLPREEASEREEFDERGCSSRAGGCF
ncbi:hypothetical protein L218DRAFT_964622 [Marasmius fiardii PR-910]|nr:hypothetical protein L218DRAFT_964622 [Marasmius fiardii PR-910]